MGRKSREKNRKQKKTIITKTRNKRYPSILAGAGALLIGLVSWYTFSHKNDVHTNHTPILGQCSSDQIQNRTEEIALEQTKRPMYVQGQDGLIYVGEPRILLSERSLAEKIKNALWNDMKQSADWPKYSKIKTFNFKKLDGQSYVKPFDSAFDQEHFNQIMTVVNREFQSYGIKADYEIKPLRSIKDLQINQEIINKTVYVTEINGDDLDAKISLIYHDGNEETITFKGKRERLGERQSTARLDENGKYTIRHSEIFITKPKNLIKAYNSIFSETLHASLAQATIDLFNKLIRSTKHGDKFIFQNYRDTHDITKFTEEAVVHGICHNWLEDNADNLGLKKDEVAEYINGVESIFLYKGAKKIRKLARKQGRKAVVQDYIANPLKYWKIIKKAIPEYQKFYDS